MTRGKIAGGLVLALTLMLALCVRAQAQTLYTTQKARLYKKNRASAKVLAVLEAGEAVELVASKGGWASVEYQGQGGFMKKAVLTERAPEEEAEETPEEETEASIAYAQARTSLFKGRKTSSKALCAIPKGARVEVLASGAKWVRARYAGQTGYALKAKLGENPPEEAPEAPVEAPQARYETLKPGDTGEKVKALQARLKELEWFYGEIGGNYKTLTTQAVKDFQEAVDLPVDGIADSDTQEALYASDAPRNVLESTDTPASGKSIEMDWWTSGIQEIFARGKTATVTDVKTGLTWREVRTGGTNHADVQPKTARDAALMKKAYGGSWSWNRRAIWVSIGGKKYAASMNGMPHGSGSIEDNDFDGHHCIHFTNSRTHGSNSVCALHQAAIREALAAG